MIGYDSSCAWYRSVGPTVPALPSSSSQMDILLLLLLLLWQFLANWRCLRCGRDWSHFGIAWLLWESTMGSIFRIWRKLICNFWILETMLFLGFEEEGFSWSNGISSESMKRWAWCWRVCKIWCRRKLGHKLGHERHLGKWSFMMVDRGKSRCRNFDDGVCAWCLDLPPSSGQFFSSGSQRSEKTNRYVTLICLERETLICTVVFSNRVSNVKVGGYVNMFFSWMDQD